MDIKEILQHIRIKIVDVKPLSSSGIIPPIKLGEEYMIKDSCTCKCGQLHLDLGLVSTYNYISCYKCGEELPQGSKRHWVHESRTKIAPNQTITL